MDDETAAQLRALEDRVAALERASAAAPHAAPDAAPDAAVDAPHAATPDGDAFWALDGLTRRAGGPGSTGAVMVVGDVTTPAGDTARWQYALTTDDVLAADWADVAPVLAALGHPVRLALLRAVLDGTRTARDLAAAVDVGSTGQVYHHLRQLQAAGWLRTAAGGEHVVPAERLVPLLTTVLGGLR
ncbi:winged helix-turn-helix transcriptional regulator [Cellulomonas sp. zg-ZUI22]|uniref:ArsR/SmtB family transcription factor n=1 Tax=Cellulomonas sp. zg-ZUI22 TaxID=2816955 RepID=UPI001A9410B8|nr:winged helix-turn-helix domain-containing protein [Cellulomonas sp. zg-ZUI22]MBO0901653.1 winged helix-turn-helix transcriptional regulator [Cellulomonas sp. zg-ZUI22]